MKRLLLLACLLAVLPARADTSLVTGSTATVNFSYPSGGTSCTSGPTVIGAGIEFPVGCGAWPAVSIDIADGAVTVVHTNYSWASGSFNGFELDIAGFDFTVAAYGANSTLGLTGLSITDGDLWLDFAGQGMGTAYFTFVGVPTSVPEPGSIGLLGLGLAGLAFARRGKQ